MLKQHHQISPPKYNVEWTLVFCLIEIAYMYRSEINVVFMSPDVRIQSRCGINVPMPGGTQQNSGNSKFTNYKNIINPLSSYFYQISTKST